MRLPSLLAALFLAGAAHAQTVTVSGDDGFLKSGMAALDTTVSGRTVATAWQDMATGIDGYSWTHQWPGVYFDAAFDAPEVVLRFNDPYNHYDLIVDGKTVQRISKPGSADVKVSGLGDGVHLIRLLKTSESQASAGSFEGFFVAKGAAASLEPATRQIEFIGDSWTVGYGNTSDKRQCTPDELWSTTDTGKAFGPIVADHFEADFQINAYSGRGMVRNYDGVVPDEPLPALYPYALFDHGSPWEAGDYDWIPQVIVIGLGGNDFSTPLHPEEKWKSQDALRADYIQSYVAFVKDLRAHNPNARFILLDYAEGEISNDVAEVARRLTAGGDAGVQVVTVHGFELTGCDWHLDTRDNQKIADALIQAIGADPAIWSE